MDDEPTPAPVPDAVVTPVHVPMLKIVEVGIVAWVVALIATLAIPALHQAPRDWWPWCCVAGILLGGIGWIYLRRGRGNAADA
ncbi:MAG: DUF2530 domain-containing protein [Micrococcales bacterium]|nr:DUF2530 domain-containing protein [Micrococcales bacterium]